MPTKACPGLFRPPVSGSQSWPWFLVCLSGVTQAKKHHLAHRPSAAVRCLLEGEARINAIPDLHHDQHLLPIRCLIHRAILGRASWAFDDLANPAPAAIRSRGRRKKSRSDNRASRSCCPPLHALVSARAADYSEIGRWSDLLFPAYKVDRPTLSLLSDTTQQHPGKMPGMFFTSWDLWQQMTFVCTFPPCHCVQVQLTPNL